ncbi:MAG: hypothetical protein AAGG53_16170 [Cyanobacteria bacterium P01_H01_bin.152]
MMAFAATRLPAEASRKQNQAVFVTKCNAIKAQNDPVGLSKDLAGLKLKSPESLLSSVL